MPPKNNLAKVVARPGMHWAIDQDYYNKLSKDEKTWLRQFTSEYYGHYFKKGVKPLHSEEHKPEISRRVRHGSPSKSTADATSASTVLQTLNYPDQASKPTDQAWEDFPSEEGKDWLPWPEDKAYDAIVSQYNTPGQKNKAIQKLSKKNRDLNRKRLNGKVHKLDE